MEPHETLHLTSFLIIFQCRFIHTCAGAIGYAIVSELFGSNSDTHVFGDALEKVRNNEKLADIFGTPVKGYGEPSSSKRRRNRRIQYVFFWCFRLLSVRPFKPKGLPNPTPLFAWLIALKQFWMLMARSIC